MRPDPQAPYRFTEAKQEEYFALLREGGRRGKSARAVGIEPSTVRRKMQSSPTFRERVIEAESEANEIVVDGLFQAAASGNVTAGIFWVQNRMPEEWKDMRATGKTDINISMSIDVIERVLRAVDEHAGLDEDSRRRMRAIAAREIRALPETGLGS